MTRKSYSQRRLAHVAPDPGVHGMIVLRWMQREAGSDNWPPSVIINRVALSDEAAVQALRVLLAMRLIERRSGDSVLRFCLTPLGRRFQPASRTGRPGSRT